MNKRNSVCQEKAFMFKRNKTEDRILPVPSEKSETDDAYWAAAQAWAHLNEINEPNMERKPIVPKNNVLNVFHHVYTPGNLGVPSLHDHPWWSVAIVLEGEVEEVVFDCEAKELAAIRKNSLKLLAKKGIKGYMNNSVELPPKKTIPVRRVLVRSPGYTHSLLLKSKKARTCFITGPRIQNWGFYTSRFGWVPYQLMADVAKLYLNS